MYEINENEIDMEIEEENKSKNQSKEVIGDINHQIGLFKKKLNLLKVE